MGSLKIDVPGFLNELRLAGFAVSLHIEPGEPIAPPRLADEDPIPRYTVLELPEGSIMSGKQADMADIVIVGGVVCKNRHGPVYSFERGREAHAMVHLGTKFDIGQRVGFLRKRGDVHIAARGEIVAVTQYRDREASYYIAPDEASKGLLGGVPDLYVDEGELHALDQVAEDPDAGCQAEPQPKKFEAPVAKGFRAAGPANPHSSARTRSALPTIP